jgi:hypothetical protein
VAAEASAAPAASAAAVARDAADVELMLQACRTAAAVACGGALALVPVMAFRVGDPGIAPVHAGGPLGGRVPTAPLLAARVRALELVAAC